MRVNDKFKVICMVALITTGLLSFSARAAQDKETYAKTVAPIFENKCIACHNHTTRQGGLSLESREALMGGGKRGPAIVPGKSGESLLVKMLEGTVKPQMPLGDKLSDEEIKAIKDWIDAGATLTKGASASAASETPKTEKAEASSKPSIPVIKPTVPVRAAATSLAFHAGGALLALGGYREVELISVGDGKSAGKFAGHAGQVRALAFSPDGKLLAAAGGSPAEFGEVKIWSVQERKELRTIRGHRDNIFAVAFSPDGTRLATASYDRLIKLWDVASGAEIKTLKDHTDAVFAVAFSPDGGRMASASADRTVKIWDAATGQRLYTLSDALDALNTVAFHPSGKQLAAAGADRYLRIWELGENEGKQLRAQISHEDAIDKIVYSPDGKLIASTGADKTIKLWDAASLTEARVMENQPDWVFTLAFSPDGKRLAAGRYDGSVTIYTTATGKGTKVK